MNSVCEEMRGLRLEGDIIPVSWYEHIRKGKNKPDLEACIILANIVYWYRPTEIRSEENNNVISYKPKFKADKLQKSYQQYADFLGRPKTAIKRAIDNLVRLKLIKREFRNFTTKDGLRLTNVMYLEPIVKNIKAISYRKIIPPPIRKLGEVVQENSNTYTETTTEITTKKEDILLSKNSTTPLVTKKQEKIPYKEIVDYLNEKTGSEFRSTTKATQRLIKSRWKEGFTLDDFKKVIDIKTKEWRGEPDMVQYLRPQTLFGTKFEAYLNEEKKHKKGSAFDKFLKELEVMRHGGR